MEVAEKYKNAIAGLAKLVQHFPNRHALCVGTLACALLIITLMPSKPVSAKRQVQSLPLTLHTVDEQEEVLKDKYLDEILAAPKAAKQHEEQVRPGDNLSLLFKRAGLSDADLMELIQSSGAGKQLAKLYPGHKLIFALDTEGQLSQLQYVESKLHSTWYTRSDKGFSVEEKIRTPNIKFALREATITNSLFQAASDAHLDDSLIMELAGIFGWDIDFILDIRQGDAFKVLFEESFLNGEKISNGNILAAEFINRGHTYKAVRYKDKNGDSQYYTPTGDTMRKEFLRTPIDFARVSSHFNLRRKHPILNTIRAHKGTDYAAPRGTPIKAAGDGKIILAGRKGGYGNTVIIQHGQIYRTLYAHLSKFRKGIRRGKRVKQGQIIGYVGTTGLATGPHLHYEFHVNGSVRNPVTVKLPKAKSVPKGELQRFYTQTQPLLAELDQHKPATRLAANHSDTSTTSL